MEQERNRIPMLAKIILLLILVAQLFGSYYTSAYCPGNDEFDIFQLDSESLVIGPIEAALNGIATGPYGLGHYTNITGTYIGDPVTLPNGNGWADGFCVDAPIIQIDFNSYTQSLLNSKYIVFSNAGEVEILTAETQGNNVFFLLDAEEPLSKAVAGSLEDAVFLDADRNPFPKGSFQNYISQFGLQGDIFVLIAKVMGQYSPLLLQVLHSLCAAAMAATAMLIVYLIYKKGNLLLALSFYLTFLMSPSIVNYARNLYWVEFTWFLPMVFGLICSVWIHKPACRILSYVGCFASVLIKCLCGYEYISAIMLASISFLLVDLFTCVKSKDKQAVWTVMKAILIIGIMELIAFGAALLMHGYLRGEGDVVAGIRNIYEQDVLRRTWGADGDLFDPVYAASFHASVWTVLIKNFILRHDVITGIPWLFFPVLVILPPVICFVRRKEKEGYCKDLCLYCIFFLCSISWMVLAKAHAYVHVNMCSVLWYFGFVQVCVYIVLKYFIQAIRHKLPNIPLLSKS